MTTATVSRSVQPIDGLTITITGNVTVSVTYDFQAEIIIKSLLPDSVNQLMFDTPVPSQAPAQVQLQEDAVSSLDPLVITEKRTVHITGSFQLVNTSADIISAQVFADTSTISWDGKKLTAYDDSTAALGYLSSTEQNGFKAIPGTIKVSAT